jgi:response regulator RpfG family c-di-GMP phosphodiesterase
MKTGNNQRMADRMLAEGFLSADDHLTATRYVAIHGGRIEEALLEIDAVNETDLLRWLSTAYGTRFVSTEKLYKAQIDPRLVALVPKKLAEMHQVIPVLYDDGTKTLTVVTSDPDDPIALHDVKLAAGVHNVSTLLARPAAVAAAIQRSYHNDPSGFALLLRPKAAGNFGLGVDNLKRGDGFRSGKGGITLTGANGRPIDVVPDRVEQPPQNAAAVRRAAAALAGDTGLPELGDLDLVPDGSGAPRAKGGPPAGPPPRPAAAAKPAAAPAVPTLDAQPAAPPRQAPPPPPQRAQPRADIPPVTLTTDYIDTLNVLMSLLENSRPDLRGHSPMVARIVKKLSDRMGLTPAQVAAVVVAAYIHDVGKAGTYHLTALNVAEYDGHKIAAQKVFNVVDRYFQSVALSPDTKAAVHSMYERYDGKGFPGGLSGKDVPLGARVLAVADTYADLTVNPRNPARRVLSPIDAAHYLAQHRGTFFDPMVLDLLTQEVAGDDLRAKILADRRAVLLVDPDPEETTVLELRLLEQGFDVRIARSAQQAVHELKAREFAVVVSEIDLDAPDAGLALRSEALGEAWGKDVTWIVHTRKTDRELAQIVFDLGVDDLVSKPTPPDVFVTKIRQLIERRKRATPATAVSKGVSGSLAEMGLPEVVQVLWHGRKTCALRITSKKGSGEIGFSEGQIVDARLGNVRGEEAFYQMLTLADGEFRIDPDYKLGERTIDVSPEGLLLEGMRRLDEGMLK